MPYSKEVIKIVHKKEPEEIIDNKWMTQVGLEIG
jgi:hypothetical protein